MTPWHAGRPGDLFSEIDTPYLILDLDAFERPLGEQLMLVPGHCDPIVNLYGEWVDMRGALL